MKRIKIAYRQVKEADRDFLLTLYASTREDVMTYGHNMSKEEKKAFVEMQFSLQDKHYKQYNANAEFLIIQLRKKDIGRLYLEELTNEFRIIDITIASSYRGKGIGNMVMKEIIDKAELKNKPVSIHVMKNNRALHLYERLGFEIKGDTGVYYLMSRESAVLKDKQEESLIQLKH